MKGGFYDKLNLENCKKNNLCKDEGKDEDMVINIYNKFLDKVFLEPDELNLYGEIEKQELAYNEALENLKKNLRQKDEISIINLYSVYEYKKNIEIRSASLIERENELSDRSLTDTKIKNLKKNIAEFKKGIESLESKIRIIPDYKRILSQLADERYIKLIIENEKEFEDLKAKKEIQEKLKVIKEKIEEFKSENYDETTNKWDKKCINKIELKNLIDSLSHTIFSKYSARFNEYFGKNMKEYMNDFNCIVPYNINESYNIFEPKLGKANNYTIYKKFNDMYYEIYSYKVPDVIEAGALVETSAGAGAIEAISTAA